MAPNERHFPVASLLSYLCMPPWGASTGLRLLRRFMEASYRRSLIAQEVLGYNADIVCLQEVDEKAFFTYFLPVMHHAGAPLHTPVSPASQPAEAERYLHGRWAWSAHLCRAA